MQGGGEGTDSGEGRGGGDGIEGGEGGEDSVAPFPSRKVRMESLAANDSAVPPSSIHMCGV